MHAPSRAAAAVTGSGLPPPVLRAGARLSLVRLDLAELDICVECHGDLGDLASPLDVHAAGEKPLLDCLERSTDRPSLGVWK